MFQVGKEENIAMSNKMPEPGGHYNKCYQFCTIPITWGQFQRNQIEE